MATALPPALQPLLVPRDALRPPSADNPRLGLSMSLVAHAALVAALALGVQWRTETPAGVSAELWAATPQLAAPPRPVAEAAPAETAPAETAPPAAIPPPPRPTAPEPAAAEREAEIAIAKAEQLRKDKLRLEAEQRRARDEKAKAEKAQAEKAQAEKVRQDKLDKAKADKLLKEREALQQAEALRKEKDKEKAQERAADAQREKLRLEQMRRMNEQLGGGPSGNGAPGSTGTAARDAGPSAGYAGRILARIKPNIVLTDEVTGNPRAEVEMKMAADGSIIGRRISKSSGSKVWDEAVLRAVDRTAVLPRDTDGRVPATIVIGFKPQE